MDESKKVITVAVIGVGTMGAEIAQVALMGGFKPVIINDLNTEILKKVANKIEDGLKRLEGKGKLKAGYTTKNLMENLVKEVDLKKTVSHADFIIEAVPEIMKLKQDLFKKLGKYAPKHAILATNTSTMSISEIASSSGRPDKVIGCHFFTPIIVLRLIEIIKGLKTSEETVEISKKFCQSLPALKGKRFLPLLKKESPGFIVNRLIIGTSLYLNWLLDHAMEKKIPLGYIDADIESLMEVGPFEKWDYLGLDVIFNVLNYFNKTVSPEFFPGKTLTKLVNAGNLGRKTGKGLFEWIEGKSAIDKTKQAKLFDIELYMAIQLNEGCRLLEEGIVSGYKIIDDTMMAGMDMPGPFGAGKKNHEKWVKLLDDFVKKSEINYFEPCDLMRSGKFIEMRK